MKLSINNPIWEKMIKGQLHCSKKDFLISIFLFVVRKSYEIQKITLEEAKAEVYNFFVKHSDQYDLDKLIIE